MKAMTKRELLLTDKYDDNDVWSILEKCTIVDQPPKGKSGKNVWVSRFNATLEQSLALLFRNDGTSVVSINGTKRKLDTAKSDGVQPSCVSIKSNAHKGASKKRSCRAPNLWEINGYPSVMQQKAVALKISKHLPRNLSRRAYEVGHFFLFVTERQKVWERRKRGEYEPWSQSMALCDYFFCNVSRRLGVRFGTWRIASS